MSVIDPDSAAKETPTVDDMSPVGTDRRLYRRYDIGLEATIYCEAGTSCACAITDLSLGGAAVVPGDASWEGQDIRLVWPDLGTAEGLAGRCVGTRADQAHISFNLDEAMESALTMFLVMSPATR